MILVTGATGYVGGHLAAKLASQGTDFRCIARDIERLPEHSRKNAVEGSVLDESKLREALRDVDIAYYLIHAMTVEGEHFSDADKRAATLFAKVAREEGVKRIIYLGALGHGDSLSSHLASRQEVGDVLRTSGIPVIELRASVIIGSGSISFEIVRSLVDKLPVMVTPRWVRTKCQPIFIDDVIAYLLESLDVELTDGGIFEIGASEEVSYQELMQEYARQRGLTRLMIPVPVLTPNLSGRWLALVAPSFAKVGMHLIDGVRNKTVVMNFFTQEAFSVRPVSVQEGIKIAIERSESTSSLALQGRASSIVATVCVLLCVGAGAAGNFLSGDPTREWYTSLAKPDWTPPSWVFGPVWTLLYIMMGLSLWRVLRRDGFREGRISLLLFSTQLAFNIVWSGIFFGLQNPPLAFVNIVLLWFFILLTTIQFSARDRIASFLLLPYLAWVSFAMALNGAIVWMNM